MRVVIAPRVRFDLSGNGISAMMNQTDHPPGARPARNVHFRVFRSSMTSWNNLFAEAAQFASSLGSQRDISISHSSDHNDGVVTVWYWA
jgi:hypothetical protein